MKVCVLEDKIIVHLKNELFTDLDSELEDKLKDVFKTLNDNYDLDLKGLFDVDIYQDDFYGIILEILSTEDYYGYFNQIEMKINFYKQNFLYEIDSYIKDDNLIYYRVLDKLYFKLKNKISLDKFLNLIEHVKIMYGIEIDKIESSGERI